MPAAQDDPVEPSRRCAAITKIKALYVTGNEGKFKEAQHVARQLAGETVKLVRVKVDLPELQGTPAEIAAAKVRGTGWRCRIFCCIPYRGT